MRSKPLARTAFIVHFVAALMGLAAHGAVYYVDGDNGNDALPGIAWPLAKQSVAGALAVATGAGDEIWVKQGAYAGGIILNPGVGLYGGFTGNEQQREQRNWLLNTTILQGSGFGSVVSVPDGAPATTVLDGFTIQMGQAQDGGGIWIGAAAEPAVRNNIVMANQALAYGGGIYCGPDSAPAIDHNTIQQNEAGAAGGGLYCDTNCSAQIVLNTVGFQNRAPDGGGIACESCGPTLNQNAIHGNMATTGNGGGVWCHAAGPLIDANTIGQTAANTAAQDGGGIACEADSAPLIRRNTLAGNSAGARGGAIACLDSSPTVVSNVVIQGNAAPCGGGLACSGVDARPEVRDQTVQQNTAYQRGGGLFADEGSRPVLLRCRLESNNASSGGGGACVDGATLHLDRCTVRGNTAAPGSTGAGGGLLFENGADGELYSCLVLANQCGSGGGGGALCRTGAAPQFHNATLAANLAVNGPGGGVAVFAAAPGVTNCIVAYNSSGASCDATAAPGWGFNNVCSNGVYNYSGWAADPTGTNGNLRVEPRFVDRAAGDYHLATNSPCVDTGTRLAWMEEALDIDHEFRVQEPTPEGLVDLGADEVHKGAVALPALDPGSGLYTNSVTVWASCYTRDARVHYTLDGSVPTTNSPSFPASGGAIELEVDTTVKARAFLAGWDPSPVRVETYTFATVARPRFSPDGGTFDEDVTVTVTCETPGAEIHWTINNEDPTPDDPVVASGGTVTIDHACVLKARAFKDGLEPSAVKAAGFRVRVIFVWPFGNHTDGRTWDTAFRTVQAGVTEAWTNGAWEVWVAANRSSGAIGPYFEHILLYPNVHIIGGFIGGEACKEQRIDGHLEWTETILSGGKVFGQPVISDAADHGANGVRLERLTIKDGRAGHGAGLNIWYEAGITVEDCIFSGNGDERCSWGGGVYMRDAGKSTFRRCIFAGNEAWDGGGAKVNGPVRIEACTFSGNLAGGRGAGLFVSGCNPGAIGSDLYNEYTAHNMVISNRFTGNFADELGIRNQTGIGGGVYVAAAGRQVQLVSNEISGNFVHNDGGGLAVYNSWNVLLALNLVENNIILDSTNPKYGIGIYIYADDPDGSHVRMTHNIVRKNKGGDPRNGGGMALRGIGTSVGVIMQNDCFLENEAFDGGNVWLLGYFDSSFIAEFCTFYKGAPGDLKLGFVPTPDPPNPDVLNGTFYMCNTLVHHDVTLVWTPDYTNLWHNNVGSWVGIDDPTGTFGNISDVAGVTTEGGTCHLEPGSPCIDAGSATKYPPWTPPPGSPSGTTPPWYNEPFTTASRLFATDGTSTWARAFADCQGDLDVQGQCGLDHDIGCDEFLQLRTPMLTPPYCATFNYPTSVVVRADSRSDAHVARVHLTTDGSLPGTDDPAVAPGARVTVSKPCVVTAVSVSDEPWVWSSPPARATFTYPSLILIR
jgi:hypothetical protein